MEDKTTDCGEAERRRRKTRILQGLIPVKVEPGDANDVAATHLADLLDDDLTEVLRSWLLLAQLRGTESIVRQALRDGIRYQEGRQKRGYRGQIALYRECARQLGIEIGKL
jgi:hypothetical protein